MVYCAICFFNHKAKVKLRLQAEAKSEPQVVKYQIQRRQRMIGGLAQQCLTPRAYKNQAQSNLMKRNPTAAAEIALRAKAGPTAPQKQKEKAKSRS